ncbi:hypothetical protein BGZ67_003266 [Mortierella alpina]|nr:hypothetical protein BGZ67_003266 [Mortierella alpina]
MGKYRLQIHIAKPGPFPASALNVRRNGEKRFLILADGDQAISELRRSIQEQYARLYENEPDFTAVQLTNKDCYELDDNYKIRDVFDSLDTVRVVGHQEVQQTPKPATQNFLKRKVEKGPAPSYADSRSTSSTPAPEAGSTDGESKKQRKKRRKAEEAAAKAAAAVASSGLFANGAIIEHYEDSVPEENDTVSSDPCDSTATISTLLDSGKGKAVLEKEAITKSHKAEQEKAAEEKARSQKEAEELELARKEVEEKKRKAEETKRQKQEEKARKEAEDKAKKETEEKARKEAQDKAKKEAEDKAKKEAEEKAKKEAEDKAKKEAEDKARKESEEKAKELAAEEEKKQKQEEKARKEAEKAKAVEEKARKAAEAKEAKEAKRKAAEESKARLAEEKARKAAELKEAKRVAAEEKKQKLAEERALKLQSKEADTRRASQSEHPAESDSEVDQLLSSPEPTDVASLEAAFGTPESSTTSETPITDQVHNEDSGSSTAMPEPEERPRRKSTVVVEISAQTAPNTGDIVNRLAPGTVPDFLASAEDEASEETSTAKAVSNESAFTTATEHPLSPKKRGRPPKVKPEATMHMSPVKTTSTPSTATKVVESKAPLADSASDSESEQELEVFSFFQEQRLKGQQPPPVINTPKPASSVFSFEPYHSTPPQRLTDKPTMASDSDSDSDASGPDYDAPPSMPPMIISSRPSISVARLRPESPRGLAISMPKVLPSKHISNVDNRKEEVSDSAEDAYDNGALTEEEEDDEPLIRTRKVVLPGVPNPMALVKEETKQNEDDDAATKDEKDELQETSDESGQSDHHNSSDDDSTSSDSESESDSDSESEETGPGSGSRSSEDQEAILVRTEPATNGSRGGGGILSGLLSLQGASHVSSNHNDNKPAAPARTSFFSLTDISAKMGLPVTSLAELTAQGRAKKIGSINSAIASPASSASSSRKAMGGMNDKGAGSSEDESSDDDEAESDSDDNTDSSDEEGDLAKKARAGPQIKIAGKKRRSSTKSAGGGSSSRKKGRLDALF